jgi:hypothetical protein
MRGERRAAGPNAPGVGVTATGREITQSWDGRNHSSRRGLPVLPELDGWGDPLDFQAFRWGEGLIRSLGVWRHIQARKREAELASLSRSLGISHRHADALRRNLTRRRYG